jgi:hypothetical protein
MLYVRHSGGTDTWQVGEPKPALTDVDYVKADGPELAQVNNTAPVGLQMPSGMVVGQWVGDLAWTVWVNV